MRAAFLASLLFVLPVAAAPAARTPARPSPHPQADAYFAAYDRSSPLTAFDPGEILAAPGTYRGRMVEVRGMVNGLLGTERRTHLLIRRTEERDSVQVSLPEGRTREDYPFLDTGVHVRVLCRPPDETAPAPGQLELVIAVREAEALMADATRAALAEQARLEEAARRRAAEERKKLQQKRLASRGVTGSTYGRAPQSRAGYVAIYAEAVRYFNPRLAEVEAQRIASAIIDNSVRHGLDARLVMAVIAAESNFNQNAVSRKGAMGLGQLMPGTAGGLGVANAFDIDQNLEGSTRLLRNHIQNMSKDGRPTPQALRLALACYNAGAGAVRRHGGVPPYRETRNYIRKITRLYYQLLPDWEKREWDRRGWAPT